MTTVPIVMLHALALSSAMWTAQRHALIAAGHQVLTPDQRGYGTTPLGPAAPSLDLAADDLAALLDRQRIDEVVLVGCSMGGYVAMSFLRRHPGRVRALALVSTRADAEEPAAAAQRRAFADLVLDPAMRSQVVAATLPSLLGATTRTRRPAVVGAVRSLVANTSPEAIAWSSRAVAARTASYDVLRDLAVPAVVVTGEEDELIPLAETQRMVSALPDASLVTVPEAGHLVPLETPAAVTSAVTGVMTRAGLAVGGRS